jgi:hypothetical protein
MASAACQPKYIQKRGAHGSFLFLFMALSSFHRHEGLFSFDGAGSLLSPSDDAGA